MMKAIWLSLVRLLVLLVLSALALQIFFVARVALMRVVDPQSTTFQRSEIWRIWVRATRCRGASNGWATSASRRT